MRAADIEKLVSVSRPAVAPDGTFAIAAVSRPDLRANLDVGQLWRFDLEGRAPARVALPIARPRSRPTVR